MTVWPGTAAMYIPKSVEGDKLEAAKKFIAFAATQQGCDAYIKGSPPQGPFLSKACKLPAEVSQVAKDTQAYFESGKASPGAGVRVAGQGPGPGADLHPGGHRPGGPARRARSSTTRTSRSKPSNSACRVGSKARALSAVVGH